MTLIKIVLIASFLGLLVWAFRNRSRVGLRAGARIGMLTFIALAIAAVIQPGLTQAIADVLGVTRGTDLVMYAVVVAFVMTSFGTYFRFREQEQKLVQIVRANAISEALLRRAGPGESLRSPDDI